METSIIASIAARPEQVTPIVTDLATYPEWLSLVTEAAPAEPAEGDVGPAWSLTLRAKVGPFARSKRLRMVRTEERPDGAVFTRAEVDGRDHATWRMTTTVTAEGDAACTVTTGLFYDGSLWSGPLEAILRSEAELAEERLDELVGTRGHA